MTWACERFHMYLLGRRFKIETDHKPLVPLFSTKLLDELPARVQRFRIRLMKFDFSIYHVPGKKIATADVLSRSPRATKCSLDEELEKEATAFVNQVRLSHPASEQCLSEIREHIAQDDVLSHVMRLCQDGWPSYSSLPGAIQPYCAVSGELTVEEGLLLKGHRLVIPAAMRLEILDKLHLGHQGIAKCRERAKASVWWPGLSKQLEEVVRNCAVCCKEQKYRRQPLIPSPMPDRPWQKVAADLFYFKGSQYLLVIDYFSRFVEMSKLSRTLSRDITDHLKSMFARHGIPDVVRSDNGPQFASANFAQFAKDYNFNHVTSSPRFPQSNGEIERAVQTVKNLLKKAKDPYMALMCYRSTPLHNGHSPAELLMGRRIRSTVPCHPSQLLPAWPDMAEVRRKEEENKNNQKKYYDKHHGVQNLQPLEMDKRVFIPDLKVYGTVNKEAEEPRSYRVDTPSGEIRRNRGDLKPIPSSPSKYQEEHLAVSSPRASANKCSDTGPVQPVEETLVLRRSDRVRSKPDKLNL